MAAHRRTPTALKTQHLHADTDTSSARCQCRRSDPPRFSTRKPLTGTFFRSESACASAKLLICTGTKPADANIVRHGSILSPAVTARCLLVTQLSIFGWIKKRSILLATSGSVPMASRDSSRNMQDCNAWNRCVANGSSPPPRSQLRSTEMTSLAPSRLTR